MQNEYINTEQPQPKKLRRMSSTDMTKVIKIPTIVDPHLHYRDLGEYEAGTISSESMASLEGGVTGGMMMPNTSPPLDTLHTFMEYKKIAEETCNIDYRLTILGTKTLCIQPQQHIDKMCQHAIGVKLFLNKSHVKPENMAYDPDIWQTLFKRIPMSMKFFVHVEDDVKFKEFLEMAKQFNFHYHICHVHTRGILDLIIKYRKDTNMNITCEACPHHLMQMCLGCHVKPTPTNMNDINYLIQNIHHIDCLATDHAPHINTDNPGIASTEFTANIYYTLVKHRIMTLERMILMACINPRILLGMNDLYEYLDAEKEFSIVINLKELKKNFQQKEEFMKVINNLDNNYILLDTGYTGLLPPKFKYSKGINSKYFNMRTHSKIIKMAHMSSF